MKKFLFWTALASVALTGCVKNDVEPNPSLGQDVEITFNQPVVGKITKAPNDDIDSDHEGEISNATYPTTEQFIVHAWAHQGNFDPNAPVVYINQQEVEYFDGSSIAAGAPGDLGEHTWRIDPHYYWPKTHKLTFTAYSPNQISNYASIDAKTGIKLTDVVIGSDVTKHIDILYSNRVFNQTYPDYDKVANDQLIGVDIQFHHALASVNVKVKVKESYTSIDEDQITIHKIWFDNVEMKGTFTEGLTTGLETSSTGSWSTPTETNNDLDLKGDINEVIDGYTTAQKYGCTALLIPQELDGNLNVNYTITNPDGVSIKETITFKLSEQKDNSDIAIDKWEQSKRYIYTLTFGLNEIYLAPYVEAWDDVTMSDINI
ncbi:MAG: fimbrillin family protein [Bacteroidaceae bacterium]|nr:fimbrillin family protein [Bacteroidaceae bacterium]